MMIRNSSLSITKAELVGFDLYKTMPLNCNTNITYTWMTGPNNLEEVCCYFFK